MNELQVTTSSAARSTIISTTAAIGSTPTSNTPINTGTSSSSSSSEFSAGAKAGVGVGSVLGVALVAAICWLAWILRKKSKHRYLYADQNRTELVHRAPIPYDPKDLPVNMPHYVPFHDQTPYASPHEAQAQPVPERHELSASR